MVLGGEDEDRQDDSAPRIDSPPVGRNRKGQARGSSGRLHTEGDQPVSQVSPQGTPGPIDTPGGTSGRGSPSPTPVNQAEGEVEERAISETVPDAGGESSRRTTRGGSASATLTPGKPPERVRGTKLKAYNETQIRALLQGRTTETQLATCQRPRYAKWGKCTQCVAKNGGDTCRFRDFRVFP